MFPACYGTGLDGVRPPLPRLKAQTGIKGAQILSVSEGFRAPLLICDQENGHLAEGRRILFGALYDLRLVVV